MEDEKFKEAMQEVFGTSGRPHWTKTRSLNSMERVAGIEPSGPNTIELDNETQEYIDERNQRITDEKEAADQIRREKREAFEALSPAEQANQVRRKANGWTAE